MAFQSVPFAAEAVVRYTLQGKIVVNTFYAYKPTGYDVSDLQLLANEVDAWVGTEWLPLQSNHVAYVETAVRGLEELNDVTADAAASAGLGGVAASPMPSNVSYAISRRSPYTGRSARGRVYVPAVWTAALNSANENLLLSTIRDGWVDALNELKPTLFAVNWVECIVSRFTGGAERATGVVFPVTQYVATDLRIDSQRRRLSTG